MDGWTDGWMDGLMDGMASTDGTCTDLIYFV